MREYDDLPYIVIERRSGGVTPFLWGALLGAGIALLLAPRSGEDTQEEIRQSARRLRMAAEDRVNHVRDTVTGTVTRTRDGITGRIDTVRSTLEARADQARHAVETGRRVAQDARSELQRRVAEAKDSVQSLAGTVRGAAPRDDRGASTPPAGEVVVTDVAVEESEGQADLA